MVKLRYVKCLQCSRVNAQFLNLGGFVLAVHFTLYLSILEVSNKPFGMGAVLFVRNTHSFV